MNDKDVRTKHSRGERSEVSCNGFEGARAPLGRKSNKMQASAVSLLICTRGLVALAPKTNGDGNRVYEVVILLWFGTVAHGQAKYHQGLGMSTM